MVSSGPVIWFQIPAGAVNMFGGGSDLFKAAIQKARKDDDMVKVMICQQ